jgi:hypothetical protein
VTWFYCLTRTHFELRWDLMGYFFFFKFIVPKLLFTLSLIWCGMSFNLHFFCIFTNLINSGRYYLFCKIEWQNANGSSSICWLGKFRLPFFVSKFCIWRFDNRYWCNIKNNLNLLRHIAIQLSPFFDILISSFPSILSITQIEFFSCNSYTDFMCC